MKLGAIADDFTGATDLANTLVKNGMRTTQFIGVPSHPVAAACEAGVVALKSRTIDPDVAVRQSLNALQWLRDQGAEQIIFKYCSTFDSTPRGNIGPVADALLEALNAPIAVVCPAFPTNARTIYKGHLFVGDELLSDSSMKDHPLTPMTDANLMRVMEAQSQHLVGLIDLDTVRAGADAIRAAMTAQTHQGRRYAVLDALVDDDLRIAGEALKGAPLITGGSGIALGLPANFGCKSTDVARAEKVEGALAILSGSCSVATRAQIEHARARGIAHRQIEPATLMKNEQAETEDVLAWAHANLSNDTPILIYSSADPDQVAQTQQTLGRAAAGDLVERTFANLAKGLIDAGVRNLVVAGGETSGAVTEALAIRRLDIGREIDPGVPWTHAEALGHSIMLALKSGNFGAEDFFTKAFEHLC